MQSLNWLITGGAGYIGSHLSAEFSRLKFPFAIIDNNETKIQHKSSANVHKYLGDIRSRKDLGSIFNKTRYDGVIHLAALKSVNDSLKYPGLYAKTNVEGTENLLNTMQEYGVKNLIFSSTAAVYGETDSGVVTESTKIEPKSYYGETKVLAELLVKEARNVFGLNFVNLRYFNVAGALNKKLQDDSKDNLIPIVLDQILAGVRPSIFGFDYPTPDGTAIRDYIHIIDVVNAHLAAINYLSKGGASQTLNIGTGVGTSVLEIVQEMLLQIGSELVPNFLERREGDIGIVVADPSRAREILGFKTKHTLREIVASVL